MLVVDLGEEAGDHPEVAAGRLDVAMAEEALDVLHVGTAAQQDGDGMPEQVRVEALGRLDVGDDAPLPFVGGDQQGAKRRRQIRRVAIGRRRATGACPIASRRERARHMSEPPPSTTDTSIPESLLSLPMRLKCALWLAMGTALGIPVDAVFGLANGQVDVARRQLAGKRLRLTDAERHQQAAWAAAIGHPFRDLVHWLISPDSLLRWAKRWQERRANGSDTPLDADIALQGVEQEVVEPACCPDADHKQPEPYQPVVVDHDAGAGQEDDHHEQDALGDDPTSAFQVDH